MLLKFMMGAFILDGYDISPILNNIGKNDEKFLNKLKKGGFKLTEREKTLCRYNDYEEQSDINKVLLYILPLKCRIRIVVDDGGLEVKDSLVQIKSKNGIRSEHYVFLNPLNGQVKIDPLTINHKNYTYDKFIVTNGINSEKNIPKGLPREVKKIIKKLLKKKSSTDTYSSKAHVENFYHDAIFGDNDYTTYVEPSWADIKNTLNTFSNETNSFKYDICSVCSQWWTSMEGIKFHEVKSQAFNRDFKDILYNTDYKEEDNIYKKLKLIDNTHISKLGIMCTSSEEHPEDTLCSQCVVRICNGCHNDLRRGIFIFMLNKIEIEF